MVKNFRARPVGWRGESHRHYLASKGISTKRYLAKAERIGTLNSMRGRRPVIIAEDLGAKRKALIDRLFEAEKYRDIKRDAVDAEFEEVDDDALEAVAHAEADEESELQKKYDQEDEEFFARKDYFSKTTKQSLPDFLLMNNLVGVRRPRLKDAFSVRRSGDSDVPSKTRLELLRPSDMVSIRLSKSKDDVVLSVVNSDSASDHHVGEVVRSSGSALSLGEKVLFKRKNVLRLNS